MFFSKSSRKRKQRNLERALSAQQRLTELSLKYLDFSLNRSDSGIGNQKKDQLVVSLTSHSHRVNDVSLTIESLFQQSLKADKIILCLAKDEFSSCNLPELLKLQQQRGLEIDFCDEDLGPYTKFYYTLKKYPDSLIVTVDDDLLYPHDMLDLLYRAYLENPSCVHCHRAHRMILDGRSQLLPYKQWERPTQESSPSRLIFPTGVGGVLYFPGCFADDILDKKTFMQLAPNSDDVWLKAMSLKKGVLCRRLQDPRPWDMRFQVIEGSQKSALKRQNKSKRSGNDSKIRAVFDRYGLWSSLYAGT